MLVACVAWVNAYTSGTITLDQARTELEKITGSTLEEYHPRYMRYAWQIMVPVPRKRRQWGRMWLIFSEI